MDPVSTDNVLVEQPGYDYGLQPQHMDMQPQQHMTTVVTGQPGGLNQNTIVNQGAAGGIHQTINIVNNPALWSTSICGCGEDISSCCMGCWCPCILVCQLTSAMQENCCIINCSCCPGGTVALRTKLRTQYGIRGTICDDMGMANCCTVCVWCQMARELKYRGVMI